VDLINITQMNVATKKLRNIRRVNPNNFQLIQVNPMEEEDDPEDEEDDDDDDDDEEDDEEENEEADEPNDNLKIFQSYECVLNQTNIGNNNNKFYKIKIE